MSVDAPSPTDKELAVQALREMPDSVTLEEIGEELAILAALRKGKQALDEGRVVSHEEVKRRSATWLSS